jgi:hypothetical protein
MNLKINLQIENAQITCLRHINNGEVSPENFINHDFIINIVRIYYEMIGDKLKDDFSFDDFKNELVKRFEKKQPTQAFAEENLETWLNSSIRNSHQRRFNAYKELLSDQGKGEIITQMDADTYKILDSCHNPNELSEEWDRRGLVYGHVQSGKTANYIGLINRAFDAGYQIVIVLTGMTEDLRSQTQRRIDEGVVGQRGGEELGIGKNKFFQKLPKVMPATTLSDDLSRSNRDLISSNFSVKEKSIWVIKKNKTVLENLILWLDGQRSNGADGKINYVPFLVIDDEADNASIQSMSKKDYESWGEGQKLADLDNEELTEKQKEVLEKAQERVIKAINRNIRVALSLMSHKTFVAYTATPYSIINQSKKDTEKTVIIDDKIFMIDENSDLFPEHFIIPITAGSKYIGIERIFTNKKANKLPVVVNVSASYPNEDLDNNYFPTKRGFSYSFLDIPKSLEDAILHFLISIIIRKHRGHKDYNSLLVHTSHLTANADYLAVKIDKFINDLIIKLPGNNGGYFTRIENIFNQIKENSENILFKKYFNNQYYFPEEITKNDVLNVLLSKMDQNHKYIYAPFEVVSYHSSNNKDLEHKNHDLSFNLKQKNGIKRFKNYIVVGGNRLSRGLTLEGLTTSYFVRNSTRQDSLYQMARWFGYRIGFEDLVRIFIPKDQILWFEGVYKLEMDLRKDFEANNEEEEDIKLLPRDAVIKMAYYTKDDMHIPSGSRKKFPAICDPNKLRNTRKQARSFSGTFKTNRIIDDKKVQANNLKVVKDLFETIKNDSTAELFVTNNSAPKEIENNKNSNYINVNYKHITTLLSNYEAHPKIKDDMVALVSFIKENKGELENWSVVLVNRGEDKGSIMLADFYENGVKQENKPIQIVNRNSGKLETTDKDYNTIYLKSILDQQKDNIFDIIDNSNYPEFVQAKTKKDINNRLRQSDIVKKYRNKSKKPLLVIYLAQSNLAKKIDIFPLLYCFIPVLDNTQKVTYIIRNK